MKTQQTKNIKCAKRIKTKKKGKCVDRKGYHSAHVELATGNSSLDRIPTIAHA